MCFFASYDFLSFLYLSYLQTPPLGQDMRQGEMQSVSSRIWTRVAVFISYDDNNYITGTSFFSQPLRSGRIWHKVNFLSGV